MKPEIVKTREKETREKETGVQAKKFWKHDFEIISNPEAPFHRPTFWLGLEVQDPYG